MIKLSDSYFDSFIIDVLFLKNLLFSLLSSVINDVFEDYKIIFCERHCQRLLIHSTLIVM